MYLLQEKVQCRAARKLCRHILLPMHGRNDTQVHQIQACASSQNTKTTKTTFLWPSMTLQSIEGKGTFLILWMDWNNFCYLCNVRPKYRYPLPLRARQIQTYSQCIRCYCSKRPKRILPSLHKREKTRGGCFLNALKNLNTAELDKRSPLINNCNCATRKESVLQAWQIKNKIKDSVWRKPPLKKHSCSWQAFICWLFSLLLFYRVGRINL